MLLTYVIHTHRICGAQALAYMKARNTMKAFQAWRDQTGKLSRACTVSDARICYMSQRNLRNAFQGWYALSITAAAAAAADCSTVYCSTVTVNVMLVAVRAQNLCVPLNSGFVFRAVPIGTCLWTDVWMGLCCRDAMRHQQRCR
jgi:hypothetical protein